MNKKLPIIMLASAGILLASCGGDNSSSDVVSGTGLKFNQDNVLAYNASTSEFNPTKGNLEKSKLSDLLASKKVEEFTLPTGNHPYAILKDIDPTSETVGKYGVFKSELNDMIIPFIFESHVIRFEDSPNGFGYLSGNVGTGSKTYDLYGNLIKEHKVIDTYVESYTAEPSSTDRSILLVKINFSDRSTLDGYYIGRTFKEGKPAAGYSSSLKAGDYITGDRLPLAMVNLPEHSATLMGNNFLVYKGNDLVTSIKLPTMEGNTLPPAMMVDGYFIYQETRKVPDEMTEYDYYIEDETGKIVKYNLKTTRINLLTGEKQVVNFPFVITQDNPEDNVSLKNKEGKLTYYAVYGQTINSDKSLNDTVFYAFNNKLEVINDYTGVHFDKLIKLDHGVFDSFYSHGDPSTNLIYYNDKEQPVFSLKDDRLKNEKPNVFTKANKFLARNEDDTAFLVDTNGLIEKEFKNANNVYTNPIASEFFFTNTQETLLQRVDLSKGIVNTYDVINVSSDVRNNGFRTITYETETANVITDFFGHSYTFSKETYPDFKIETLVTEYNRAYIFSNGETVIDYYFLDLGF